MPACLLATLGSSVFALALLLLPTNAVADVVSLDTQATLRALSRFQGLGEDITVPIADGFKTLDESVTAHAAGDQGRGTAAVSVDIAQSLDRLTVRARGSTDIESPGTLAGLPQTGSGGAVGLSVRFCVDERASFVVSSSLDVQTNGATESSDATFDFPAATPPIAIVAEDAKGLPRATNAGRSGVLEPGCYGVDATTNSSLGDTQSASKTAFAFDLDVTTNQNAVGDVFRWIGPSVGVFAQDGNWDPTGIPAFVDGVRSDTALFEKLGSVDVDVTTLAGLSVPPAKSRGGERTVTTACSGPITRTIGRLQLDAAKDLELVNGTLALNALSLEEPSLTIENNGLLELRDAGLCARHAVVGGGKKPSLAIVSGPGGKLETLARLSIGSDGKGSLQVRDGGVVSSEEVRIGDGSAPGEATVTNATWTTGNVAVGFSSTADLVIENAGLMETAGQAFVDFQIPAQPAAKTPKDESSRCIGKTNGANVAVRGTSSLWRMQTLALGGRGCVEVTDGGRIVSELGAEGAGEVVVGTRGPDEARLVVSDGASVEAAGLLIGHGAPGRLIVAEGFQNNPKIDVDGALVVGAARETGGNGLLRISGDPSTDDPSLVSDTLRIPDDAISRGQLTIEFGGRMLTSTRAEVGIDGNGFVDVLGAALGSDPEQLTSWQIGEELVVGPHGIVVVRDAGIVVGTLSTPGHVTIQPGGIVFMTGSAKNLIRTNGGLITNHGTIVGPAVLDGVYDPLSSGRLVQQFGTDPNAATTAATADAPSGARAVKPIPTVPQGPVVFTSDPNLSATTLVLQFLNGFAPAAGAPLAALDVPSALLGEPTSVDVQGLAPGAAFTSSAASGTVTFTPTGPTTALPVVRLAGKSTVKEKAKLALKVSRTGDTTQPLLVTYTIGGTASNGIDYAALPGTIEIPAKKKAAKLVIPTFADGLLEGPETLELTLVPTDAYAPSAVDGLTATIVSKNK